ncbi:hypothetical protein SODG_001271 [Sodalis praecaptivus]
MLNIALARQSRTAPQLADAMLLLVAVIWSSSYAATKQALAFYPVLGFIALRFTLTFLVLVPQLRGAGLTALRPGLPLGLILLGIFICETKGVAIIRAGNAAFLISLFVIFTPLVEWLVCRGRLDGRLMLAALLSLLGVYWLCGGSALRLGRGEWLVIAAALLRACLVCYTRRLTVQRPVPALALTAVQTGVVAAGSWLLLFFTFRQPPPLPASWQFWGSPCIWHCSPPCLPFSRKIMPPAVLRLRGSRSCWAPSRYSARCWRRCCLMNISRRWVGSAAAALSPAC